MNGNPRKSSFRNTLRATTLVAAAHATIQIH
jgi:hypothetical protein